MRFSGGAHAAHSALLAFPPTLSGVNCRRDRSRGQDAACVMKRWSLCAPAVKMPPIVKEFHFCVIFSSKKFVLSMIICIFAALVPAEPLYNA